MKNYTRREWSKKISKFIDWGWKGITVLIYTDITKDPKKIKFNFYSIVFPFIILGTLILLLLYDRIEKMLITSHKIEYIKKQEMILYNLYYSLKFKETLLKNINYNLHKVYPKNLQSLIEKQYFIKNKKDQNHIHASTKIEEEILLSNQLRHQVLLNLKSKPQFLLEEIWHKSHIYNIIPKGIPMYPGTYNITSLYGNRQDPLHQGENFHNGIDFAAPQNTPILAASDGIVLRVKNSLDSGYGYFVVLHHGLGFQTLYAHCNRILVEENQVVEEKNIIALVGKSGRATGNHLHYEVIIGSDKAVDPMPFIKLK